MNLFHFTDEAGRVAIGDTGSLRPGADGFVWLTDMAHPFNPAALLLHPDSTLHRYRVKAPQSSDIAPWLAARGKYPDEVVWALELRPGGQPAHWYIATGPVPVVYAPIEK